MPWNQPGGNENQKDPWGNGKQNQGPPDLDKIFINLFNKFRNLFYGKGKNIRVSPFETTPKNKQAASLVGTHIYGRAFPLFLLIALAVWFLAGLFIVNPAEEAVVVRFGRFVQTLPPGLHWIPTFIETSYKVNIQKIYTFPLQGDFITKSAERGDLPNQYIQLNPITGKNKQPEDLFDRSKNLVNVELSIQYRISDPRAYLFNVINPDQTIQAVASGALSDAIGQMKLDEVLTTGRELVSAGVSERIKSILQAYNTGIEVVAVNLRKVQAPDQVRAAFNDVNRADQDRATLIQHAQAYASKVVPIAQGEAARILANAQGYRQQVVLNAQAEVAKYQALAKVYQAYPDVTRERLYLQAMENILKHSSKILVDAGGNNNVFYLPLDQLLQNKIVRKNDTVAQNNDSLLTASQETVNTTPSSDVQALTTNINHALGR